MLFNEQAAINHFLSQARRRVRFSLGIKYASRTALVMLTLSILWLAASRVELLPEPGNLAIVALMFLPLFASIIYAAVVPIYSMQIARLLDERANLKERITTALEFNNSLETLPMATCQAKDTYRTLSSVKIKDVFPLNLPREAIAVIVCLIVLAGVFYLPTLPIFWSQSRREDADIIRKQGIQLEKLALQIDKASNDLALTQTAQAAKEALKLAKAMKLANMSRKEAFINTEKLTRSIQDRQQKLAQQNSPDQEAMKRAAEEFKNAIQQADKANPQSAPNTSPAMKKAEKAMKDMIQAMAEQNGEKMSQSMHKISESMKSGKLSPAEMQKLGQKMSALSKALSKTNMSVTAKELEQLGKLMQSKQLDAETLKKMAQMAKMTAGQCKSIGKGQMDEKTMQALLEAIKNGRLKLARGKGAGSLWGGQGVNTAPLKTTPAGNPKLTYTSDKKVSGNLHNKITKDFQKYVDMGLKPSKNLPNAKIKGQRNSNPTEMVENYTGDPEQGAKPGTPYYQIYTNQKQAAENPVSRENIPAAYRKQVRDYFNNIKP